MEESSDKKEVAELNQVIEKKTNKIFKWIKNPLNLSLCLVLIISLAIRIYYFLITYNQPLWWDETCYGSIAKNMVYHTWDGTDLITRESIIRPLLLPFLWSLFIRAGLSEAFARFFLEVVPSLISIFFVYLIGKEIYGKKAGIIAAFVYSLLWIQLFYTFRFLTNVPDLAFLFSSIYFFIKATKTEFKPKYFTLSLFLLTMATLFRYPDGMVFFIYLIMLFLEKKFLIKKKEFWISGIIGMLPLLIFFVINFLTYGNIFPALFGGDYLRAAEDASGISDPFAFSLLKFIPSFLVSSFFIFFIVGFLFILFEVIICYNLILKNERLKWSIFLILLLIVFYSFFIFYLRSGEDRYFLPITLSLCCFVAIGLEKIIDFIKKYNKILSVIILIAILLIGAYSQITFADSLIKNKKQSFLFMKQGFEWLKQNSLQDEIVLGRSIEPYAVYYAERRYAVFPENISGMNNISGDYLVLHAVNEFKPEYAGQYLYENQDKWVFYNAIFADKEQTQPLWVVYKRV